jgi:hypothetical protein
MKIIELKNGNLKLEADEVKIIQSKATHYDEEQEKDVPDVEGTIIYLGKNDSVDNYVEVDEENIIITI